MISDYAEPPLTADAVFPELGIIIELKMIDPDFSEETIFRTLDQICSQEGVGMEECLPFILGVGPLPLDIGAVAVKRLRNNLRANIRKAKRQLNSTRELLKDESYKRVLLMANSGVTMMPEVNIVGMILAIIAKSGYWSEIDAMIYWSGNASNKYPWSNRHYKSWQPVFENDEKNASFGGALDRMGTKFLKFCSERQGEPDQNPMFLDKQASLQLMTSGKLLRPKSSN